SALGGARGGRWALGLTARPRLRPAAPAARSASQLKVGESAPLGRAGGEVRRPPGQAGARAGAAGADSPAAARPGSLRPPQPRALHHRRRPAPGRSQRDTAKTSRVVPRPRSDGALERRDGVLQRHWLLSLAGGEVDPGAAGERP